MVAKLDSNWLYIVFSLCKIVNIFERREKTKDKRQNILFYFLDNNIFLHYNFHFGVELCYTIITQLAHSWHTIDAQVCYTIITQLAYY